MLEQARRVADKIKSTGSDVLLTRIPMLYLVPDSERRCCLSSRLLAVEFTQQRFCRLSCSLGQTEELEEDPRLISLFTSALDIVVAMNPHIRNSVASTALLVSLTYIPLLLSLLSFYPQLFANHPVHHFLLGLAPWWLAYLSARWYIRLAERSSPLYHPLGCLTQCCIWVFHWVVSIYHACFRTKYSMWTYLITVFCAGIAVITEGLFHSLIQIGFSDTADLGTYEDLRRSYGKGLVVLVRLWYLVDMRTSQQQTWNRARRRMQSRSMTM